MFSLADARFFCSGTFSNNPEEQKWLRFFDNPSLWLDYRTKNHGEFKHVYTGESLSVGSSTPGWVKLGLKCITTSSTDGRAQYRGGEKPIFSYRNDANSRDAVQQSRQRVSDLVQALKASSSSKDLARGMKLHAEAAESGSDTNVYVGSSLMELYSKCGRMHEARKVFDRLKRRDRVSWNTLILGYAENGQGEQALELYERMHAEGFFPDSWTFVAAVKACTKLAATEVTTEVNGRSVKMKSLDKGMAIHSSAKDSDCLMKFVASSLVDMYAQCGSLCDALQVFEATSDRDVPLWNVLVLGLAENGEGELAIKMLGRMKTEGCEPNTRTFIAALKACSVLASQEGDGELSGRLVKVSSLSRGMAVHSEAAKRRHDLDSFVANSLVDMYSKCRSMEDAQVVFDRMKRRDVVSWTALISGYSEDGQEELALQLLAGMHAERCTLNSRTYVASLKACASLSVKEPGVVMNGRLVKAVALEKGMALHSEVVQSGFESDVYVNNTLIDMYSRCGALEDAWGVFVRMKSRSSASYNALMTGCAENGEAEEALTLLERMEGADGCSPNARSFVAALKACSALASEEDGREVDGRLLKVESLKRGRGVHRRASVYGYDFSDLFVGNSLVGMYANCGCMLDARKAFDSMQVRDLVSWNVLMLGYAENEDGWTALQLFESVRMQKKLLPDSRTCAAVLKACGAVGALETGRKLHEEIRRAGLLKKDPLLETCVVDFYGRCGSMSEAEQAFESCSVKDSVTWNALMAGYGREGNVARVFQVFEKMQDKGVKPVGITFLCVLAACSHAGLVEKGKEYFDNMSVRYGVSARIEHYHCVIDMFSRANRLSEAMGVVESMPFEAKPVTWTIILSACVKWKNEQVGRAAFEALVRLGEEASAYVMFRNIS